MTERLRELLNAATPGPWELDDTTDATYYDWEGDDDERVPTGWFRGEVGNVDVGDFNTLTLADAALIVAAVNALPALLDVAGAARRSHPPGELACDDEQLHRALERLEATR